MKSSSPLAQPAWQALTRHAATLPQANLRDLFAQDPERAPRMTLQAAGLTLDYSRQRISPEILQCLLALAEQCDVAGQRDAMFAGQAINATEQRAVLHPALRASPGNDTPWGADVGAAVQHELARVCDFAERVRSSAVQGHTGVTISDVVNIGIGGSDLGPRMAAAALDHLAGNAVRVHYASNPDPWAIYRILRDLDPARTLFVVSSKTFTTQETLTLAATARRWLSDNGCPEDQIAGHFAAITASPEQALAQGYRPDQTFLFWDWVGGRYSVWSALGLPLAIAIGAQHFRAFLAGAHAMDQHFRHAPLAENLPVLMALSGIWNRNFLHAPTQLLTPYASRLAYFPSFIQQMDMESNGKQTHVDGSPCLIETGPIVWGGLGIDGQHAYFQLLHQGKHLVPVDFIGVRHDDTPLPLAQDHHRVVTANLIAQTRALGFGRDHDETLAELLAAGLAPSEAARLAPHRTFPGNVPSHVVWLDRLDPASLGALIALYEHKVFTQAAIWGIHAFDQWGVELGKKAVREVYPLLDGAAIPQTLDPATRETLRALRQA